MFVLGTFSIFFTDLESLGPRTPPVSTDLILFQGTSTVRAPLTISVLEKNLL